MARRVVMVRFRVCRQVRPQLRLRLVLWLASNKPCLAMIDCCLILQAPARSIPISRIKKAWARAQGTVSGFGVIVDRVDAIPWTLVLSNLPCICQLAPRCSEASPARTWMQCSGMLEGTVGRSCGLIICIWGLGRPYCLVFDCIRHPFSWRCQTGPVFIVAFSHGKCDLHQPSLSGQVLRTYIHSISAWPYCSWLICYVADHDAGSGPAPDRRVAGDILIYSVFVFAMSPFLHQTSECPSLSRRSCFCSVLKKNVLFGEGPRRVA